MRARSSAYHGNPFVTESVKQISVNADNGHYPVYVGADLATLAAKEILATSKNSTSFIIVDDHLPDAHVQKLTRALDAVGAVHRVRPVTSGEQNKTLQTFESLCRWLLDHGAERTSPVIAMGGGIVGDITGFVAASYQRGAPFFQMPTTLLSMVDASVGGKVAVNLGGVKNMIGSFYQPRAVFADIGSLRTLDARQMRCGLAECLKHGVIGDRALFDWTLQHLDTIMDGDVATLTELVYRNVAFKSAIVERDPTEKGDRALLNLGHTFGHAIEKCDTAKNIFHGEAVAIGMVAACHLAEISGMAADNITSVVEAALAQAGLPTRVADRTITPDALLQEMKKDKKSAFKSLNLILPQKIGQTFITTTCADDAILRALRHITR